MEFKNWFWGFTHAIRGHIVGKKYFADKNEWLIFCNTCKLARLSK